MKDVSVMYLKNDSSVSMQFTNIQILAAERLMQFTNIQILAAERLKV